MCLKYTKYELWFTPRTIWFIQLYLAPSGKLLLTASTGVVVVTGAQYNEDLSAAGQAGIDLSHAFEVGRHTHSPLRADAKVVTCVK